MIYKMMNHAIGYGIWSSVNAISKMVYKISLYNIEDKVNELKLNHVFKIYAETAPGYLNLTSTTGTYQGQYQLKFRKGVHVQSRVIMRHMQIAYSQEFFYLFAQNDSIFIHRKYCLNRSLLHISL